MIYKLASRLGQAVKLIAYSSWLLQLWHARLDHASLPQIRNFKCSSLLGSIRQAFWLYFLSTWKTTCFIFQFKWFYFFSSFWVLTLFILIFGIQLQLLVLEDIGALLYLLITIQDLPEFIWWNIGQNFCKFIMNFKIWLNYNSLIL